MELTLPALEDAVWQELARACTERGHSWRHAVLATVDGDAADARTVILRSTHRDTQTLLMYTDARSAKLAQVARHPLGTLVMWSAKLGWQLRARVSLSAETSGLQVSSRWAQLKLTPAAYDYLSPLPPGSPLQEPAAPEPERASREHFALLVAQVQSLDWLALSSAGHRRARFGAAGAGWLVP
jgi:pyridoxamine 5'-phosphate oxidase